ncbi:rhodanese-like domain-containing protein [Flavobacteriaceae bacterium XHP0103]|uniref:rhodanese-like domain-containing protein n=1 Tax=Marixanthotalea marina TaxID=2844359 RepID=UPI002989DAA1|nr:rhodanese-like domain-containing protein [Marixanthotalea marina]MBU3821787.1 rhodanese-like domain-containing protein [Marixanthotalea marina]
MGLLDFLLKHKTEDIKDFLNRGAIIIDVRTETEYKQGAINGSKNIPLQSIESKISAIKKMNKPIITCCASGMRSGNAASILNRHGIETMNGGGWASLNSKLKKS